jgi:hypothetical protein
MVTTDDATDSLRLLRDRLEETQAVCRLHRLIAELTPGDAPGTVRRQGRDPAAGLRPRRRRRGRIRMQIAQDHLAGIKSPGKQIRHQLSPAQGTGAATTRCP